MYEDTRIRFTIDGQEVYAEPGETVMSVAKRYRIGIPTHCHHESIAPYGACRLCVVESFWARRSQLVTSCAYTPWGDERIETNTERVRRARKMILEELFLARTLGGELSRTSVLDHWAEESWSLEDANRSGKGSCILSGLCAKVCAEVNAGRAGSASRSTGRAVSTPPENGDEECIGCGACAFVCPSDALPYGYVGGKGIMKELNTASMASCRVCGDYFATVDQVERARVRLELPRDLAETCPRCRGLEFRKTLETYLFSKGASNPEVAAGHAVAPLAASRDEE